MAVAQAPPAMVTQASTTAESRITSEAAAGALELHRAVGPMAVRPAALQLERLAKRRCAFLGSH